MADASSVDFRALQLFIAVYDNQSFSVVARREGVSPSLISRTIQQLEDALGQQLFYRNTRAVVPTEAGRLFAASARELLGAGNFICANTEDALRSAFADLITHRDKITQAKATLAHTPSQNNSAIEKFNQWLK